MQLGGETKPLIDMTDDRSRRLDVPGSKAWSVRLDPCSGPSNSTTAADAHSSAAIHMRPLAVATTKDYCRPSYHKV